ncbi:MAG TPA: Holliday junction resolvase RuvX [Aggregatilineales bacterium]|nr:Holliday junction resolvase RuvX [Anaerolineales bacterium]HRE47602.1 Holliday junction resolvase RuvX [Aggregatilineales bacterium]
MSVLLLPPTSPRGVLLGIDYGTRIIGVALCDASRIITRPLQIIQRTTREAEFAILRALIAKYEAVGIVVGLPLPMEDDTEGSDSIRALGRTVRRWASRLGAAVNVPIFLWDERYSSFEADLQAIERGEPPSRGERLDHHAAAIILEAYLKAHREQGEPGEKRPDTSDG